MQYFISQNLEKLPEDYFEVLSKTRVKSSLLVLHDQITENEFRYCFMTNSEDTFCFMGIQKLPSLPTQKFAGLWQTICSTEVLYSMFCFILRLMSH